MKSVWIAAWAVAALTASPALAFERDMLNLETPSGLDTRNVVIEIQHRFYGPVNENAGGTILGMTRGANVGLGFR